MEARRNYSNLSQDLHYRNSDREITFKVIDQKVTNSNNLIDSQHYYEKQEIQNKSQELSSKCWTCGHIGHRKSVCPQMKCFYCGKYGHIKHCCLVYRLAKMYSQDHPQNNQNSEGIQYPQSTHHTLLPAASDGTNTSPADSYTSMTLSNTDIVPEDSHSDDSRNFIKQSEPSKTHLTELNPCKKQSIVPPTHMLSAPTMKTEARRNELKFNQDLHYGTTDFQNVENTNPKDSRSLIKQSKHSRTPLAELNPLETPTAEPLTRTLSAPKSYESFSAVFDELEVYYCPTKIKEHHLLRINHYQPCEKPLLYKTIKLECNRGLCVRCDRYDLTCIEATDDNNITDILFYIDCPFCTKIHCIVGEADKNLLCYMIKRDCKTP